MKRTMRTKGNLSSERDETPDEHVQSIAPRIAAHAAYIRDMVFELRSIAEKHNLVVLAYFLDMAYEEATEQAQGDSG